jgi:ATP-dependent Zn protease
MTIEEMNLEPVAKKAATILQNEHPELKFTSGRRTIFQQAHAMAGNVVFNRKWIGQTYLAGAKLQQWVDQHPEAKTVDAITAGLEQTMKTMPEAELLKISRHLTGKAFDVTPVTANAATIKADILKLPGLHRFLDKEGGLVRWHAQFQ